LDRSPFDGTGTAPVDATGVALGGGSHLVVGWWADDRGVGGG